METVNNIPIEGQSNQLGNIEISPEVIEVIAGIVTGQVDGVHSMHGGVRSGVTSLLGKESHNKGVTLSYDEMNRLIIDIYLSINYGASLPKVATTIQQKVKEQVLFMCDIHVDEVNIHVVHAVAAKQGERA